MAAVTSTLMLLVVALLAPQPSLCSHCAHTTAHNRGGVRGLGYFFSETPYGAREAPSHGRGLASGGYAPIRILVHDSGFDPLLSTSLKNFVTSTLVPTALEWVQQALQCVPRPSPSFAPVDFALGGR